MFPSVLPWTPRSEPPQHLQNSPFRRQIRNQREQGRASGIKFEAAPGPVQLKLRMRDACVWLRQFKLRTLATWSPDWQIS
eukprot:204188-Alexandrium_andersonii.AAC.1